VVSAMKAMVYHDYGSPDVVELSEIEMPVINDDGVLVRVHAASVNWLDWHFLTGTPFLARIMVGWSNQKTKFWALTWRDRWRQVEQIGGLAVIKGFDYEQQAREPGTPG
jgi:hypothetical protein